MSERDRYGKKGMGNLDIGVPAAWKRTRGRWHKDGEIYPDRKERKIKGKEEIKTDGAR